MSLIDPYIAKAIVFLAGRFGSDGNTNGFSAFDGFLPDNIVIEKILPIFTEKSHRSVD